MKANKNNETKFEIILKSMNSEDKATVMRNLYEVEQLFKQYSGAEDFHAWLEVFSSDEALRNIWICSNIASQEWFNNTKREEKERVYAMNEQD